MSFAQRLPPNLPPVCYQVRDQRLRLQLTLNDLAATAGVSERTVWNFEHGQFHPNDKPLVARIQSALESAPNHSDLVALAGRIAGSRCWSAGECAERSGIPKTTWQRVMKGARPTPATREKFAGFVERWG